MSDPPNQPEPDDPALTDAEAALLRTLRITKWVVLVVGVMVLAVWPTGRTMLEDVASSWPKAMGFVVFIFVAIIIFSHRIRK